MWWRRSRLQASSSRFNSPIVMRLVTWNCCRGAFLKKAKLLNPLAADIAVIQECAKPDHESSHCLWFGDNPRQGIAVLASSNYHLTPIQPLPDVPKYMFPVQITGPENFTLLAVWAKGRQQFPYVEGVFQGVEIYRALITGTTTLLVGDLNSNKIWNDTHPSDMNHSSLVQLLAELDLVSCYHQFLGERQGQESKPTYYFHWKQERPYHIDYCFAPTLWAKKLCKVEVGSFKQWREHSDHRPLLVEFALNQL